MIEPDSKGAQYTLNQTIRGWAKAIAALPDDKVIIAHPNAPRPAPPYCMINIISGSLVRDMGGVTYEDIDLNGEPRVLQRRLEDWQWTFSINLYGEQALDQCRVLTSSLRTGTVLVDHFEPMAVRDVSMVRNLPELVDNAWEPRAQFDLTLAGIVMDGFLVDVIEQGELIFALRVGATDEGLDVTKAYLKPAG